MKKYDTIKLENQLCFSMYAASKEIIRMYTPLLEKFGLTYTQYITMLAIWEKETVTVKELGKILHLDSGTLTPLIKKLENMELIKKFRDPNDERRVIVTLQEKGIKMKDEILEVPENILCKFPTDLKKLKLLKEMLDSLIGDMNKE